MFITIITDCRDANAKARLGTRTSSFFNTTPTLIGVGGKLNFNNINDPAEYEAAGNLIDVLDAAGDEKGIVLVNVANRHGKGKKWPNGTPFGYFYVNNTLIVSTIDGITLSLIKKLELTNQIKLLDIPEVIKHLTEKNIISDSLAEQIINTQFRSFEFQPRVAKWLYDGLTIPASTFTLSGLEYAQQSIWYVDNFGNCKTTILPEEILFKDGKMINFKFAKLQCKLKLKDVADKETALIIGSSGYKNKRFLEIVVQGENAAEKYKLSPGINLVW